MKNTQPTTMILLFTRWPTPGKTKTRLIPALGPAGAARLHRRMTENAVGVARSARQNSRITVCFTGATRRNFRAWLGADLQLDRQRSGNLGVRMQVAFADAFQNGNRRALVIGSDVPNITPEILHQAMRALNTHDAVIGPARDGGYYLLGMKQPHRELFTDIAWGTEQVYAQTMETMKRLGLSITQLPELQDVDRPDDLNEVRQDKRFADIFSGNPEISVIIPTLNEENSLSATLKHVGHAENIEILVADGGSQDATCKQAADRGADILHIPGGRARQQNVAANAATGHYLLFLHADTRLPNGYADQIYQTLDDPAVVAGAFRFQTDAPEKPMRLVEWGTHIRSSIFQRPYCDQGLFMEKRIFHELGGFKDIPIMEDFELVRRLRKRGRIITLHAAVITSARRWKRLGIARTTLRNQMMIAGFSLGISPAKLARFYRDHERNSP